MTPKPRRTQRLLKGTGYLNAFPDEVRDSLLSVASTRFVDRGVVVLRESAPCSGLFVVVAGLVKLSKISHEGRSQVLRVVQPGGSFNEVAALDGGVNPASGIAVQPSELLVIPGDRLFELLTTSPSVAQGVMQLLAARLRHMAELVEDLSFRHVSERVARVLLQSIAPHPGVGAGIDTSRRISQREIAEMVGSSREVVARALKSIEDAGAITRNHGQITIIDPGRLAEVS